jgi:hypothetical protein
MRALLAATLLTPSLAAAAPVITDSAVTLSEATFGTTQADAIAKAIRKDDNCQPACAFAVDKKLVIPAGTFTVQHATNTGFDSTGYIVTFAGKTGGIRVWSTEDTGEFRNPAVSVTAESSGMSKTLNEKLEGITVQQTPGMLWVRFRIEHSLTRWLDNRGHSTSTSHLEYAIGCRLGEPMRCAAVGPRDRYADNKITIAGDTASVAYADDAGKPRVDRVKLVAP